MVTAWGEELSEKQVDTLLSKEYRREHKSDPPSTLNLRRHFARVTGLEIPILVSALIGIAS